MTGRGRLQRVALAAVAALTVLSLRPLFGGSSSWSTIEPMLLVLVGGALVVGATVWAIHRRERAR